MSKIDGKLKHGLETLTALDTSPVLAQSMRSLGSVYSENSLDARRGLRGDIERHALDNSREVLGALQGIHKLLERVRHDLASIRGCCDDLDQQLSETKSAAGTLTARAAELKAAREDNERKSRIAEQFAAVFVLQPAEAAALAGGDMTEAFFAALGRVHAIANSAKLLVRSAAAQQAGLDILDRMGDLADGAYDKITVYAQQQFQKFTVESPEPPTLLRVALELLSRERPSLTKYCVEEVEQVRKQALVNAFVKALTVGGPGGMPPAMDANSTDVVRYTGDMLAWFHQSLASEKELMAAIFGSSGVNTSAILGASLASCCRPLRTRLDNVLKSNLDIVLAHDLRSLLQFYRVTLGAFVTSECAFAELLAEFQMLFRNLFDSLVAGAALEAKSQHTVHPDLGPPSLLHRAAYHVSRICETFESSLLPAEERTAAALLDPLVAPLMEMCLRMAENLSVELGSVFLINCFVLVRDIVAPFPFAEAVFRDLMERIQAATGAVAEAEARTLLTRAQLHTTVTTLRQHNRGNVAAVPRMEPKTLQDNVKSLEAAVLGDLALAMGASDKVHDTVVRDKIRALVVARLVEAYTLLYNAVHDSENHYPEPSQIVQYVPSQFEMLLK